jgi:polyhydroxyalkanoate synthesis regulator phasin
MMKINQVLDQAKQAARDFVALKSSLLPPELTRNRRELTNKRILAKLKKLGVATHSEVRLLQSRIEKLEAELKALKASR